MYAGPALRFLASLSSLPTVYCVLLAACLPPCIFPKTNNFVARCKYIARTRTRSICKTCCCAPACALYCCIYLCFFFLLLLCFAAPTTLFAVLVLACFFLTCTSFFLFLFFNCYAVVDVGRQCLCPISQLASASFVLKC